MDQVESNFHLSAKKRRKTEELNRQNERTLTDDEFRLALFSDIAYAAEQKIGDHNTPEERLTKAKLIHSEKYPHLGFDDYEIVESNKSMLGAINRKNNKAVVAIRGSNFLNIRDYYNVFNIASNGALPHNKQKRADKFIEDFVIKYSDYDLTLTGHSAGGYHCEYNAVTTGLKCESFNSGTPVFPGKLEVHLNIKSHIINLDIIALRAVPGQRIQWERERNVGRHRIENFIKKYDRQHRERFGVIFGGPEEQENPESIKSKVDEKPKKVLKSVVEGVEEKIEEMV